MTAPTPRRDRSLTDQGQVWRFELGVSPTLDYTMTIAQTSASDHTEWLVRLNGAVIGVGRSKDAARRQARLAMECAAERLEAINE